MRGRQEVRQEARRHQRKLSEQTSRYRHSNVRVPANRDVVAL